MCGKGRGDWLPGGIMGGGHMGIPTPCEQTDMTESITFRQIACAGGN